MKELNNENTLVETSQSVKTTDCKIGEFFGGIGACSAAFRRLGIPFEVADYVEIDKYACKSYNAINNTNFEPQDIKEWDKDIKFDLIMHGSPCQDYSIAGRQAGGDEGSGTRSSLMYETIRIINKTKPKVVIWENVKNLLSNKHKHNFDNYLQKMSDMGYTNYYKVLNAKDYGVPQNRERVFTISILGEHKPFEFPKPQELHIRLKNILEEDYDSKFVLSDKIQKRLVITDPEFKKNIIGTTAPDFRTIGQRDVIYNQNGVISTLCATDYKQPKQILCKQVANLNHYNYDKMNRVYSDEGLSPALETMTGGNRQPKIIASNGTEDNKVRKLSPKECWRLMGFSDEDFEKAKSINSDTQLYKQAGNSIVVNVLVEIIKKLKECETI